MMNRHERCTGEIEQGIRAELALPQARYDGGAPPPFVFSVVRSLQVELAWLEHRGGNQK
jgi:hypothetical protein